MKERVLTKALKSNAYLIALSAMTLLLFAVKGIFSFLFVKNLAGTDLIGNYSLVWLMNGFMKGFSLSGWTNMWFAGMPAMIF
jgi:hypothetical protein